MTFPTERLDEETEGVIESLASRAYWEGRNQSTGTFKNERINEKRIALRQRIRTLIEEARKDATQGWMLVGPAQTIFPEPNDLPPQERVND